MFFLSVPFQIKERNLFALVNFYVRDCTSSWNYNCISFLFIYIYIFMHNFTLSFYFCRCSNNNHRSPHRRHHPCSNLFHPYNKSSKPPAISLHSIPTHLRLVCECVQSKQIKLKENIQDQEQHLIVLMVRLSIYISI